MKKIYLASGWFNPTQDAELTQLEKIFDERADSFELASPRRIFVCPPNAPKSVQDETFTGNLHHIQTADFLLVNTRDKDIGTIWETGYAYAFDKPIIYFCAGLPKGAKFNLMLARSGIKVCTSFKQLEDYLDRAIKSGELPNEPYADAIE
jgi:nucleoside 2-deoxyribosyltransferase